MHSRCLYAYPPNCLLWLYLWKRIKKKRVRNHFPFYSIYISYCCSLVTNLCPTLCDPMDQAALSMGFSRQEYWSGLPCPPPGDLADPGIEPVFPALEGRFFTTDTPGKHIHLYFFFNFWFWQNLSFTLHCKNSAKNYFITSTQIPQMSHLFSLSLSLPPLPLSSSLSFSFCVYMWIFKTERKLQTWFPCTSKHSYLLKQSTLLHNHSTITKIRKIKKLTLIKSY